ncbi:MAG: mobile mystery protein A [Cellvibrionaceae bacterium]
MSLKKIVTKQYQERVNQVAVQLEGLVVPSEGWLRTVRKALGMSGAQLARRMGVTRGLISNTEKAETAGGVTLRNMQQMAQAMDCRFIYAVVPQNKIEDIIRTRAFDKAQKMVSETSVHMALEEQVLSEEKIQFEIERLALEMIDQMNSELWNDE